MKKRKKQQRSLSQDLRRLFPYLIRYKWLFIPGTVAMLLVTAGQLAGPLILAGIIDEAVPQSDTALMLRYAAMYVGIIVSMGFISYWQIILMAKLGVSVVTNLKSDLFNHMLKLPVSFFQEKPVGELIARVENDAEQVKSMFSQMSVRILGSAFFFIGVLGVMLFRNAGITLRLMIPVPLIVLFVSQIYRKLNPLFRKLRNLYAEVVSIVTEYIQGAAVVQIFNHQETAKKKLAKANEAKAQIEVKASFWDYGGMSIANFLMGSGFIIFIILLMGPQILAGALTIGTLIIFIEYGRRLFEPLMVISEHIVQFQRAFVSLQRIFTILDTRTELEDFGSNLLPALQHSIEFRNVTFSYTKEELVLDNVSFTLKKGETLALVGPSGSGKTTTIGLICGFFSPQSGEILIDGVALKSCDIRKWRQNIGLILQDVYLFPGSVLENVRIYNDDVSKETVLEAIQHVHAEDLIKKLDGGLHSEIHEGGQNLSMGEKQLLSFARALAFSPELVIMDEATASIDVRTEKKIQESMNILLEGKTALIIAHRLSSVINADQILFFQKGKILDRGTHKQLMQTSPEYQNLVRLQLTHSDESNEEGVTQ